MAANGEPIIIAHFVGASPGSISIRHTLERLVSEISLAFGLPIAASREFNDLQSHFHTLIKQIGSEKTDRRLILVLDALNQLDSTNHSHTLDWLPEKLPQNVRLVVSTLEGDVLDALRLRPISEMR